MKKIRAYMGKAESATMLKGMVELDDAYFSTNTSKPVKQKLKRGKGSQRKSKVTVMAESSHWKLMAVQNAIVVNLK